MVWLGILGGGVQVDCYIRVVYYLVVPCKRNDTSCMSHTWIEWMVYKGRLMYTERYVMGFFFFSPFFGICS